MLGYNSIENPDISGEMVLNEQAASGKYKDDPYFEEMLEDIKALCRERDAEMEEYYRQLDAEDEVK